MCFAKNIYIYLYIYVYIVNPQCLFSLIGETLPKLSSLAVRCVIVSVWLKEKSCKVHRALNRIYMVAEL